MHFPRVTGDKGPERQGDNGCSDWCFVWYNRVDQFKVNTIFLQRGSRFILGWAGDRAEEANTNGVSQIISFAVTTCTFSIVSLCARFSLLAV